MKRKDFLRGGAAFLSLSPITPLTPILNPPTSAFPLPFATSAPTTVSPNGTSLGNTISNALPAYIGVVGPQSGAQVDLQRQIEYGVRGAISDANNKRAPLDRLFDVHLFDDFGISTDARSAASSAVSDVGVMAVVGHLGSSTTLAALETYAQAQMPIIVPVSTSDEITRHGYTNVFRLPTRDTIEGQLFARYLIKTRSPKSIAVVIPTDGYGPEVGIGFANECKAKHIPTQIVHLPVIAMEDELTTAYQPLLAAKPDIVFFAGTSDALTRPVQVLAGLGCKGAMTASQGFFNGATIKQLGPLADGFLVSSSMPPLGKSAAMSLEIEAYHESYGDLTPMAAFSYAATQIIITALRRVNAVSRAPLSSAIASGGTYDTLVGDFRFDAFGDQADPNLYFYAIKRGAWVAAGSVRAVHFL